MRAIPSALGVVFRLLKGAAIAPPRFFWFVAKTFTLYLLEKAKPGRLADRWEGDNGEGQKEILCQGSNSSRCIP